MGSQFWVQTCANNSITHRHKKVFLKWLKEALYDFDRDIDLSADDVRFSWNPLDWRTNICENHPLVVDEILDHLDSKLVDSIDDFGEIIASVEYDQEGMAHSGWNAVYEFCGIYTLQGSDFSEGPSANKEELLEYLDTDDSEHIVFWSDYAD